MNEIQRITPGQPQYPALLKEIRNFPKELFCLGDISLLKKRSAAVVGSRKTSQYGRSMAVSIARHLSERDVTIVSGMASGIDTCAHRGALAAAGSTIAVLGCGVDVCYPRTNEMLKAEIEQRGLVLSEYSPGTTPRRHYFPRRNRIISGLSELTVVVQAGNNSGALITAELAADQGREVYAVPGNIDSSYNLGNNKLIRDGACPLINAAELSEAMGLWRIGGKEMERQMGKTERIIYDALQNHGEMTIDELCRLLSRPPAYVNGIVTVMEMKGFLFSALGKIFIAKD